MKKEILIMYTILFITIVLSSLSGIYFAKKILEPSEEKEYICKIDRFEGVPICYEVEGKNCNEEEGSYLVSTPYSYNYKLDKSEESRLCIYPEQLSDSPCRYCFFKTKGIIKLESLHWNNLYK